jgi:hypothetical protein|tara:strand:+ start:361 stop:921 length:561 start_codon:yes stop_codon:yes gene_type:complete
MAFVTNAGGNVIAYNDAADIRDKDQRVFEANEIVYADAPTTPTSLDEYLEDLSIKAMARINEKVRASAKWRNYLGYTSNSSLSGNTIPAFNPNKIAGRQADWTDLASYYVLKEYLLPKVADFGDELNSEVQKISYYASKFDDLFTELLDMMDWYDAEGDGLDAKDKLISFRTNRRTRAKSNVTRVR